MTDAQLINRLVYSGVWLLKILLTLLVAGIYAHTMPGFRDGEPLVSAATEISAVIAFLGTGLTSWLDSNRPRLGSEGLAADVKELQADGLHRSDMTVISKEDAAWIARVRPLRDDLEAKRREGSRG